MPILTEISKTQTTDYWVDKFLKNGNIPHSPINTIDRVLQDPQVEAREMLSRVPHKLSPSQGIQVIANPLKFSSTSIDYSHPERKVPTLGIPFLTRLA